VAQPDTTLLKARRKVVRIARMVITRMVRPQAVLMVARSCVLAGKLLVQRKF